MVVREAGLLFRGFTLVKKSYHVTSKGKIDTDLRSGLLTAILNFAQSTFSKDLVEYFEGKKFLIAFIDDEISADDSFEPELIISYAILDKEKRIEKYIRKIIQPLLKQVLKEFKTLNKGKNLSEVSQFKPFKENLDRIFDRFYQVADPRSSEYKSTGIGLALAKELVELHSGTIHVESVYEHGSEFSVRLPLGHYHLLPSEIIQKPDNEDSFINVTYDEKDDIKAEQSMPDEKEKTEKKHNPIILIVDDNPDIQKYIVDHLSKEYCIFVAKDGKEGF